MAGRGTGGNRRGDRSKAAILRAATEIFARKGFDGTRIAEIADRAKLPKANVYYYFPAKRDIYRQIIDDLLAEWNQAFDCITADRDPAEAIAAYIRAKLEHARTRALPSRVFANETLSGTPFLSRRDHAAIRDLTRRKAAVVEAWIAQGRLAPIDPGHFFILLWGATQFYADFHLLARDGLGISTLRPQDFDAAAATITRIVLHGCAARPG